MRDLPRLDSGRGERAEPAVDGEARAVPVELLLELADAPTGRPVLQRQPELFQGRLRLPAARTTKETR